MRPLIIAFTTVAIALHGSSPDDIESFSDDGRKEFAVGKTGSAWESGPGRSREPRPAELPPERYFRADTRQCSLANLDRPDPSLLDLACTAGTVNVSDEVLLDNEAATGPVVIPACDPNDTLVNPLWVQRLQPDGTYTTPEQATGYTCLTPADLTAEARRAFAAMHIPAPTATLQTGDPTTLLVNAYYPAYTTTQPVTLDTTLLGIPVQLRATPAEYMWDFDDPYSPTGSTLTTTNPGTPWTIPTTPGPVRRRALLPRLLDRSAVAPSSHDSRTGRA